MTVCNYGPAPSINMLCLCVCLFNKKKCVSKVHLILRHKDPASVVVALVAECRHVNVVGWCETCWSRGLGYLEERLL